MWRDHGDDGAELRKRWDGKHRYGRKTGIIALKNAFAKAWFLKYAAGSDARIADR